MLRVGGSSSDGAHGCRTVSSRSELIRVSHRAVIRVYDDAAGNVIETHEHNGDFKEP
jgi:hypothetical protein